MSTTSFSLVYDSFFSKITDDMYMELTELDTYNILQQLLLSAIEKFEFPRVNLNNYQLFEIVDERIYNGVDSDDEDVAATIYGGGCFNESLTHEEINILAVYMIVEWLSEQLASVQNVRMKYSSSDYKFTSQAAHMQRILQLKKDYQRQGFHLQRLYCRRITDKDGIKQSTFGIIMEPTGFNLRDSTNRSNGVIDYETLINKPKIESHTLIKDKTFKELGMDRIYEDQLDQIFGE